MASALRLAVVTAVAIVLPSLELIDGASAGRVPAALVAVPRGGAGVVSVSGFVGSLEMGTATGSTIEHFAGKPGLVGAGTFQLPQVPPFTAYGYNCTRTQTRHPLRIDPTAYRPSHVYCQTVYYTSRRTGVLTAFWTSSPAFRTLTGTRPGTPQSSANAKEDGLPEAGCHTGIERESPVASLLIQNEGGHGVARTRRTLFVVGGFVADLQLELRAGVGLLLC